MKAVELFDLEVREFVWSRGLPVGCSSHVDLEFSNCYVIPLHLVDLQLFFLILDPLGILIVFDLLL